MAQIVQDDRRLVGARVDPQVREQLFALARREDRSVSSVVRRALVREIERDHRRGGSMDNDVIDSFALGDAPTSRRLPTADLKRASSIWGLTPRDAWRLRQARRHFVEAHADDFDRDGRDFVDKATGTRYRLEKIRPDAGRGSNVQRHRGVLHQRRLHRLPEEGRCSGSSQDERDRQRRRAAAVVSDYEHAKKLEDIARRKDRFKIPETAGTSATGERTDASRAARDTPRLAWAWRSRYSPGVDCRKASAGCSTGRHPPTGAQAVDQILGRLR